MPLPRRVCSACYRIRADLPRCIYKYAQAVYGVSMCIDKYAQRRAILHVLEFVVLLVELLLVPVSPPGAIQTTSLP